MHDMDISAIRADNFRRLLADNEAQRLSTTQFGQRIGMSQSQVSQIKHGKNIGEKVARRIEEMLGLEFGWMDQWHGQEGDDKRRDAFRTIPLIGYVEAGAWTDSSDAYSRGDGIERLPIDVDLASRLSPVAFALEIEGDSMTSPDGSGFSAGDRIIVDPRVQPRPGDFVVAKVDDAEKATFKRFRDRGTDRGARIIHLVPLNPDYATLVIDAENPGRVVGVMMEHRRRRQV